MQWQLSCIEHVLKLDQTALYMVKTNDDKWGAQSLFIRSGASIAFTYRAFRHEFKRGHRGEIQAFALIPLPDVDAIRMAYQKPKGKPRAKSKRNSGRGLRAAA